MAVLLSIYAYGLEFILSSRIHIKSNMPSFLRERQSERMGQRSHV